MSGKDARSQKCWLQFQVDKFLKLLPTWFMDMEVWKGTFLCCVLLIFTKFMMSELPHSRPLPLPVLVRVYVEVNGTVEGCQQVAEAGHI